MFCWLVLFLAVTSGYNLIVNAPAHLYRRKHLDIITKLVHIITTCLLKDSRTDGNGSTSLTGLLAHQKGSAAVTLA